MYSKILLIDDDEDEQFFFTEALKEIGTPVKFFFASTANDGIKLLKFLLPDIVFIDINMPIINGFDCLEIIKTDYSINKIPVIIYSTSIDKTAYSAAMQKGATDCVKKQGSINDLVSALKRILSPS